MTCQEFVALIHKSPFSCTRAEIKAVHNHKKTCTECCDWFESQPVRNNVSPLEDLACLALSLEVNSDTGD